METGQHPQLLSFGVVTETDLTLSVSGAAGRLEGFGGKPLDFPPTQLPGHDSTLTLLERQQSLVVISLKVLWKLGQGGPPSAPPTSPALTNQICASTNSHSVCLHCKNPQTSAPRLPCWVT